MNVKKYWFEKLMVKEGTTWGEWSLKNTSDKILRVFSGNDESLEKAQEHWRWVFEKKVATYKERLKRIYNNNELSEYGPLDIIEPVLEKSVYKDGKFSELVQDIAEYEINYDACVSNENYYLCAITRNRYGAKVLCVDKVWIADIDFATSVIKDPIQSVKLLKEWIKLKGLDYKKYERSLEEYAKRMQVRKEPYLRYYFWEPVFRKFWSKTGQKRREEYDVQKKEYEEFKVNALKKDNTRSLTEWRFIEHLRMIGIIDPSLSFRIYRTKAGLRVFESSRLWDINTNSNGVDLLRCVGSDIVYWSLCKRQKCFRARLTAKPWRIGLSRMNFKYPGAQESVLFKGFCEKYDKLSKGFRAAYFFKSIGSGCVNEEASLLIKKHDNNAQSEKNELELA